MERVAFVLEDSGEQLRCLLNPETLVMRRKAGIQPRQSSAAILTGHGLADDCYIQTGGGTTTLELDLLFDINIAGSTIGSEDVRDLTRPFWNLAENNAKAGGSGQVPVCRFVWGKSWNIPGVVTAVAERLEHFNQDGVPQRSWLRLRLLRVNEPPAPADADFSDAMDIENFTYPGNTPLAEGGLQVLIAAAETEIENAEAGDGGSERPDLLSFQYFGDPGRWRELFSHTFVADPLNIAPGTVLEIGPAAAEQ
ncbi:hypothetical protein [Methylomonas koyamae]|uniref:CIS tube protein n=1 Tax=Methylomonas koyamae TaxID=702114 RepID=UPI000BC2FC21|nr:hypothetical protein [Methylomonas koyamae]ATG91710.1 hypothetical protein MKLM6_3523 [Methylomonas koyamae]